MRAFRRLSFVPTTTAVVIALAILSVAQTAEREKSPKTSPKINIKNFGSLNETFYRGAQPKEQDYADLAAMGVKTVIDLQRGGQEEEQALVEAQGMKFYRIPMSDTSQPGPGQADEFLKIVNDPANHPVFVHCAGGRHRTGAMAAIYRMTRDGWSADQAFLEMKRYDFEYGMGHGSLKRYVYDFYSKLEEKPVVADTNK
jgi:tyrosine-protein phosphatase SIW14